MRENENNSRDL
ncbi:Protein of unknown function [Escherichia coli D6-117.29]|nr:Protein of unknown function [Escherichia coli D6-117.29]